MPCKKKKKKQLYEYQGIGSPKSNGPHELSKSDNFPNSRKGCRALMTHFSICPFCFQCFATWDGGSFLRQDEEAFLSVGYPGPVREHHVSQGSTVFFRDRKTQGEFSPGQGPTTLHPLTPPALRHKVGVAKRNTVLSRTFLWICRIFSIMLCWYYLNSKEPRII